MDRFLPMPSTVLFKEAWGVDNVRGQYIDNEIELKFFFLRGGNIL